MNIFLELAATKTMPELDALRIKTVEAMKERGLSHGAEGFYEVQDAFIKAKNRLQRIPLRERTW